MDPPLPPGWSAARDPASGRTYYYEHSTRRTAWTRPAPPAPAPDAEELPPGVERSAGPAALPRPAPGAAATAPRAAAPPTVARPGDAPAEPVAETRAAAPTRKHRLNTACTFVIAPGASGANFCYELTECLRRLGHATEVERWHSAYSKDIKRNADRLELVAKEAAAASGPGCRVLLVGDGYGGRVVAHLLARWADGESPRTSGQVATPVGPAYATRVEAALRIPAAGKISLHLSQTTVPLYGLYFWVPLAFQDFWSRFPLSFSFLLLRTVQRQSPMDWARIHSSRTVAGYPPVSYTHLTLPTKA